MHLGAVTVSGHHDDILTSLLGGWTVPPVAFLYTREVTTRVSGWDERFHQMDDVAYLIAAAMAGAKMTYSPGCYSVYRRYGNSTVSTTNREQHLRNAALIFGEAEASLTLRDELTPARRIAPARSFHAIGRGFDDFDLEEYRRLLVQAFVLCPDLTYPVSRQYDMVRAVLGVRAAERLAQFKRRAQGKYADCG
jgi:hypothetical protein